ncbi:MAG TPA: hypothetical protein VJY42_05205, partial [Candidatus Methanomethylophilaceae archaeon]|nr:hypothetical protein [Candidatus Methanomethylophilaceae archaeon]
MRMNRKGMIGMPVRLAITFLILAITVPLLMGVADDLRNDVEASDLAVQADIVTKTAEKAYYAGIGSEFTANVSIDHNGRLIIGGDGSDAYCVRMIYGDKETGKVVMDRPLVKISKEI